MAIFHDSGEKSPILEQHSEVLSKDGLEQYIQKFGEERAIGYLQAMRDFNHELKGIIGGGYIYYGPRKSDAKIRGSVIKLFHENDEVIHSFVSKFHEKYGFDN